MVFLKERRGSWHTLTTSQPDTGTHAAHTMFMRELDEQQWEKLRYDITRKELIEQLINKSSSVKV
jgi:hypothetical protein